MEDEERPIHCGEPMSAIVYGMPDPAMLERDDVAIGGCVIWDGRPRYRCGHCGATAGHIDDVDGFMADDGDLPS